MPSLTDVKRSGDVVKYHLAEFSVDTETVLAGDGAERALLSGNVLGRITDGGKLVEIDFAAEDGSQNAAGVLLEPVTAPDGTDAEASVVTRHAVVSDKGLIWPSGATTEQKNAAIAQLKTLGIITREGV
jgi:Bacteriophage lambda head decoration protein D